MLFSFICIVTQTVECSAELCLSAFITCKFIFSEHPFIYILLLKFYSSFLVYREDIEKLLNQEDLPIEFKMEEVRQMITNEIYIIHRERICKEYTTDFDTVTIVFFIYSCFPKTDQNCVFSIMYLLFPDFQINIF